MGTDPATPVMLQPHGAPELPRPWRAVAPVCPQRHRSWQGRVRPDNRQTRQAAWALSTGAVAFAFVQGGRASPRRPYASPTRSWRPRAVAFTGPTGKPLTWELPGTAQPKVPASRGRSPGARHNGRPRDRANAELTQRLPAPAAALEEPWGPGEALMAGTGQTSPVSTRAVGKFTGSDSAKVGEGQGGDVSRVRPRSPQAVLQLQQLLALRPR